MEVKGTAFLGRKSMIVRELGAERFDAVLKRAAAIDPVFDTAILATTRIPIDAFMRLNDRIVAELYEGDEHSYFRFGEASAEWGLTEGPYKRLVTDRSVDEFVASAPLIYRNYFTTGEARSTLANPIVLELFDIDLLYKHVYFEYAINGYFRRGLEMVSGKTVKMRCVKGFSKGDNEVIYHYFVSR